MVFKRFKKSQLLKILKVSEHNRSIIVENCEHNLEL